jgi:hypothetical protein
MPTSITIVSNTTNDTSASIVLETGKYLPRVSRAAMKLTKPTRTQKQRARRRRKRTK